VRHEIHGELLMLGFDVSERTISRWMKRAPRDPEPAKRWLAFLRNHREAIAAMDFFTVPTITFGVLDCFFVISHDRRRILYFNVTKHPTSLWTVQQLREAFPFELAPRFLRPRCEVRAGGSKGHSIFWDEPLPNLFRKPLAKWCGGALG
jgi:putative transposase